MYIIILFVIRILLSILTFVQAQDEVQDIYSCPTDALTLTQKGGTLVGEESDVQDYDYFGLYVSLSNTGNILAVGAPYNDGNGSNSGSVKVYKYDNNRWLQQGSTINGENVNEYSGRNVLSGDGSIIAIASIYNNAATGHVRVFRFDGDDWVQMGSNIDGFQELSFFGDRLAISDDGTILAVGANEYGANEEGQVRVFQYNNTNEEWEQIGNAIDGEGRNAWLSRVSLSEDGKVLAVGEPRNIFAGTDAGRVRIYQFADGNWIQIGQDLYGNNAQDRFGHSIVLSADGSAITIFADPVNQGGYVTTYTFQNDNWVQNGSTLFVEASGDGYGNSIALSGNGKILVVGDPFYNVDGSTNNGRAEVYYFQDDWIQILDDIVGQHADQNFGHSVSVSKDGSTLAIGGEGNFDVVGRVEIFQIDCDQTMLTTQPTTLPNIATKSPVNLMNNTDTNTSSNTNSSLNVALVGGILAAIIVILLTVGAGIYCFSKQKGATANKLSSETKNSLAPSNTDQTPVGERHNAQTFNLRDRIRHDQAQSTDVSRQHEMGLHSDVALQEPVVLEEVLPEYKDQVRCNRTARGFQNHAQSTTASRQNEIDLIPPVAQPVHDSVGVEEVLPDYKDQVRCNRVAFADAYPLDACHY